MLTKLVSNSWPQVICLSQPPRVVGFQVWATVPGLDWLFKFFSFFIFETGSGCLSPNLCSAVAGRSTLEPPPPMLKPSYLRLLSIWYYRCASPRPANFIYFFRDGIWPCCPGRSWNSWAQAICLPWPPKVLGLQVWAIMPSINWTLSWVLAWHGGSHL